MSQPKFAFLSVVGQEETVKKPAGLFTPWTMTYENTAFLFDVDDCLITSTKRNLTPHRQHLLRRLHDVTGGAVILVTNSDMRGIETMVPGFPCVSEHGTLYRHEQDGEIKNLATEIDTDAVVSHVRLLCQGQGEKTTECSDALYGSDSVLKLEAKQNSVAIVFGPHSEKKEVAYTLLYEACAHIGLCLDTFEIYCGKDAIELRPVGYQKHLALDAIMQHSNFAGRMPVVFGDSGPDALLMKAAADKYRGYGHPVGDGIAPCRHSHGKRMKTIDDVWRYIEDRVRTFEHQKIIQGHDRKLILTPNR